MQSKATTVKDYLASLPDDRRRDIEAVRAVILKNIDPVFSEGMQYGMIGYAVPHSVFPAGYHCDPSQPLPFAGLASQKGHMSLYVNFVYGSGDQETQLRQDWAKTGKKLDMGKCCIRFKRLDDLPLEVIGRAFKRATAKRFIADYEAALSAQAARTEVKPSRTAKKAVPKKTAPKATASKATKKVVKKASKKTAKKTAAVRTR